MTIEDKPRAWPDELPDSIDIALDPRALPDDGRPEPMLASIPFFIEFDEPVRLDPTRLGLLWELPPPSRNPMRLRGPFGSLLVHLLPLLTVLAWPHPAIELPQPIPVQLVIVEPPPPPPEPAPKPPEPQPPKTGPLASEDLGDVKPQQPGTTTSEAPPAAGEKQPEAADTPTQTAAAPPPPPIPPPKPAPPKEQSAFKLPKPAGAPVPRHDETPHEAQRSARFLGPAASRDEYLAYLAALTRQHLDLLSASVVGSRRGETIVSVAIQDNGRISRISVSRSSGYPDLDKRVEEMVAAVGRFPPVPQWFQGNVMELELTVHFPEAAAR